MSGRGGSLGLSLKPVVELVMDDVTKDDVSEEDIVAVVLKDEY